jgi:hypothetical protein
MFWSRVDGIRLRARIAYERLNDLQRRRLLRRTSAHNPVPLLIGEHREVLHRLQNFEMVVIIRLPCTAREGHWNDARRLCNRGEFRVASARSVAHKRMGSTLKRIQRPFFGNVRLSCAYCKKQALRRGSVGTDSLLKLPR